MSSSIVKCARSSFIDTNSSIFFPSPTTTTATAGLFDTADHLGNIDVERCSIFDPNSSNNRCLNIYHTSCCRDIEDIIHYYSTAIKFTIDYQFISGWCPGNDRITTAYTS
ncbi:hypothetical protein CFIO01_10001 [Colletotrichum fioriniae PJ7]|uniref:Uncharacterized protein n=1 Tax=Colletotrichum fioriniae PJ7 TaxID=1445577 RepID=A0A010R9U0_9PEZI|nr:hypothetical protein CFIO01_10001 [Colletotrichum fioriniae PJ7]